MRPMLAICLTLLASYAAAQDDRPIPQDHAKMEALDRECREWHLQTFPQAYDRVGKKNPKWDDLARGALDLLARKASDQIDPPITDADIRDAMKKAVDAGCDDPLVRFYLAFLSPPAKAEMAEFTKKLRAISDAMKQSAYPPIRKAFVFLAAADYASLKENISEDEKKQVARELDGVLELLPKSMAEDPRGEQWYYRWNQIIRSAVAINKVLSGDHKAAFDRVDSKLAKFGGAEYSRLAAKGAFYIDWAWEARGGGYANTVTEEGFRLFDSRLNAAREALEQAWKLNPASTIVPNLMLTVETGNGGGDREAMETWFERAMRNNGNDHRSCSAKLNWLDPKWYGDEEGEEMVAFGRACAATKNWGVGLPILALDAHYRRFTRMEPGEWKTYIRKPDVWADFSTVYPEHLKRHPDDHIVRSKYAMACFTSEHFQEAKEQFDILGDNLCEWITGPRWDLEELKRCREETTKYLASQKK
ncbi:hypothetical protein [Paludisphaera rhizosphaerae]|uniref:hypothetical protein n=1 Tax=Paludisphaera rhizosphaerae TaxID=2711216 RepID=UPI0013ED5FA9|nr:hypothetical protein [Paludisphaera rhizosphaerae]